MSRQPLDFDALYGKAFRITDNSGDPSREGFSIVTPENGDAWTQWRERPEFKDVVRQHFNDPGYLMDHKYDQIVKHSSDLKAYAQRVLNASSELDGIYLIGSTTKGAGHDVDLLYDFGEMALDPNDITTAIEILLEDQQGIDLESYDTFVKVNGRFFHLSTGAGRAVVENTEYGREQAGKPVVPLAVRGEKIASDKKPTKDNTREFAGLPIVVEWDEGEIRHGKTEDGKEWERIMAAPYGYIKDTMGAGDKEGLDVYLGANENAPYVFVIEQLKDDGSFDEYKTMLGFDKEEEAVDMYCKHYPKSWRDERLGHVETFPLEEFKQAVQANRGDKATPEEKTADDEGDPVSEMFWTDPNAFSLTSALTSADKEFIEALGNRVLDEKEVGDYDLALIESTMIPDFYQLGMQRHGMSMADPAQQMQKQPVEAIKPGWRAQVSGILGVIDGWLASHPRLYVASHNPEKTAQYVNLLKRLGYKMGEQHIEFHGLELDVPYIGGKAKHAALRLLADSPQITPHRYEQFEEGTNGWALQQDRRKGEFGMELPDIKPMLENGEAVNDPYSVGVTKKGPIQDSGKVGYTKPTPGIPLGEEDVPGFVYLIHTAKPFHHLRHYLGWTQDLDARLEAHRTGRGANIMRVLKEQGIDWEVARTWKNVTRKFERRLKNQGGLSRHCPLCAAQGLICPSRERTKALEVPEGEDFVSECKTGSSKWLYHVTFSGYLDGISSNGLVPNAEPGITGGGEQGKVFATEASGVGHWLERATQWAYHRADNPAEEGLVPCVLRFPRQDLEGTEADTFEGHQDVHKGDHVPPENIEMWNGKHWDGLWLDETVPVADDEGYLLQDGPVQNPKLAALSPQESELLAKLEEILKVHDQIKDDPIRANSGKGNTYAEALYKKQQKTLTELLTRLKALGLDPNQTFSLDVPQHFLDTAEESYADYKNGDEFVLQPKGPSNSLDNAVWLQENALMNLHAYLNREITELTDPGLQAERERKERMRTEMRERRKKRQLTSALLQGELFYWNDVYDSHGGETYGSVYASLGNSSHGENDKLNPIVGKLDYGVYEDEVNVKMLEVRPEYRRQGIATKLYAKLKETYPDMKVNHGMTTPSGEAWLKSQTASWDYTWGPWSNTKFQTLVKYTPDYPEWVSVGFSQTEQQAENLAKLFKAANPKAVTQVVPFSMEEWRAKHAASRTQAARAIAMDDELFNAVANYTGDSDTFDNNPAIRDKFVALLRTVTPSNKKLFRGERTYDNTDRPKDPRGFRSWSANYDTAMEFARDLGSNGVVRQTVGPIQAISLEDIVRERNRSHPGESQYPGMQAEWFVLNGAKTKLVYYREEWQRTAAQRYSAKQVIDHMIEMQGHDIYDWSTIRQYPAWELKDVSLSKIIYDEMSEADEPMLAESYAKLKTPFPPIVLDAKGNILDGRHRFEAALSRGDSRILAFVPVARKNSSLVGSIEFLESVA